MKRGAARGNLRVAPFDTDDQSPENCEKSDADDTDSQIWQKQEQSRADDD